MSQAGFEFRLPGVVNREPSRSRRLPEPSPLPQLPALWLCLHLPRLALEVYTRFESSTRPLAIIDTEDRLCRVIACDEQSAAHGVREGLALNTAFALMPALESKPRDSRRERAALARLAAWAGQYTPRVSLCPPDALLLEVRGSLTLFGGLEKLEESVRQGLRELGYTVQPGFAPTPLAASWLARAGKGGVTEAYALAGGLATVPLSSVRWPEDTQKGLHEIGVRSVGDCLRLPRDGLARRFGIACLVDLDRALGKRPDPRHDFHPPTRFSARLELPAAMQALEPLRHAFELMLRELSGYLRGREGGVQLLHLDLVHYEAPVTGIRLELAQPTRDSDHLLGLLMTRLERIVLPAPVLELRLRSGPVLARDAQTAELLTGRTQSALTAMQLIERLRARLGAKAVHGVDTQPDHRPETAWCLREPGMCTTQPIARTRPLWLLSQPQPLDDSGGYPSLEGPLELLRGPERIETGWWDDDVTRDYYVARNPQCMRVWIYRERQGERRWFLQGVFA